MILRFSDKGSPYVELDDHNRFIFSRLTANERGIKYLLYSNVSLNNEASISKARDNWFTTMFFKNPKNGKANGAVVTNLGIPHSFKSNIYWKNGTVSVLRKMIGKHLLPTGEFPEMAFPALAEDIVKYNRLADSDKKKLIQYVKDEEKTEEEQGKKKPQKEKVRKEKVKKEKPPKKEKPKKEKKPQKEKIKIEKKSVKKIKTAVKKRKPKIEKKKSKKIKTKPKKVKKVVKKIKAKKKSTPSKVKKTGARKKAGVLKKKKRSR